jgi:FtsP/CotA-like multicopper oxidase with cupredoxin domain
LSRRRFLQLGAASVVVVGGGFAGAQLLRAPTIVSANSAAVAATEAARRTTGNVVRRQMRAAPATVDLGGRTVRTWAYDGTEPGPEIRLTAGDELHVSLINDLPDPTTVHWHGLALRNDMDGVPALTQDQVGPAQRFYYAFVVPHSGTYWFHPHVGVQLDTGLHAPLIVDDPAEPGDYDEEVVLVLDDWIHGWGDAPNTVLERMRREGMVMVGGAMQAMDHGEMSIEGRMPSAERPLGTDTGDVAYPAHLINGRSPKPQ